MNPYGEGGGQFGGYGGPPAMANDGMLSMGMLQSLEQMMGGGAGEYGPAVAGGGLIFSGTQEQMATVGGTSSIQLQTAEQNLNYQHRSSIPAPMKTESTGSGRASASSNGGGPPSRYESQKRRDWNTFGQYLNNHRPPLALSRCSGAHVLEFLRYLDKFGKTKVHAMGCPFFGHPQPPAPCACPLRQAWGSLDALIGRLRAAYEENGGRPESNPFGARAVRLYLREVREVQAKARGIAYEKKKRKRPPAPPPAAATHTPVDHAIAASASNSCVTILPTDRSPHYASMPPPSSAASATTAHDRQSLLSGSSSLLIPSFNGSFN